MMNLSSLIKRGNLSGVIFLACFFVAIFLNHFSSAEDVFGLEKSVLLQFKRSIISDPEGLLDDWKSSSDLHHCSWFGVSCNLDDRISSINISRRGYSNNFSCLRSLRASFSGSGYRKGNFRGRRCLLGKLTAGIGKLEQLRILSLPFNGFYGEIPVEIWGLQRLEVLNLEGNSFTGSLPSNFRGLSMIRVFNLAFNKIVGQLPVALSDFTEIEELNLAGNLFNGTIPSEIWKYCAKLKTIDLSMNSLEGEIPYNLGSCRRLEYLSLFSNNFHGKIPSDLGQLRNLQVLDISRNNLSGYIPPDLGKCLKLSVIVISQPDQISPRGWVGVLHDEHNHFNGEIPAEITVLPNLQMFWAPKAGLRGQIPNVWGSCDVLSMVNLGQNSFTGQIPVAFNHCKGLRFLDLSSNQLTGKISNELPVPCMNYFNVSMNGLDGIIPRFVHTLCPLILSSDRGDELLSDYFLSSMNKVRSKLGLWAKASMMIYHDFGLNNFTGPLLSLPIAESKFPRKVVYVFLSNGNKLNGSLPRLLFQKYENLNGLIANLSQNTLSGEIPSKSSIVCSSLMILDISNNKFTRSLPLPSLILHDLAKKKPYKEGLSQPFLNSIPPLKFLKLSLQNLKTNARKLMVVLHEDMNSSLTGTTLQDPDVKAQQSSPSQSTSKEKSPSGFNAIEIASITSASAIVSVLIALVLLFIYTRKRGPRPAIQHSERKEVTLFTDIGVKITFEDVVRATGNFNGSNCIGSGGFGATYKAEVSSGVLVAIKRLLVGRIQGVQQFHAEIRTLSTMHHPNLVTLIGYHFSENEMFLIYNYLPGGNLEKFIRERSSGPVDWHKLHKIALDIATALAYLHDQDPRVLHRDVKPSNILLDKECNAYLSDFGLARLLGTSETHATTGVAGTFGYVAPEYAMTCRVSDKADVYSYGVVLLELLSDKKALDPSFSSYRNGFNIVGWASLLLRQGRANEFFMSGLWDVGPHNDLVQTLHLAVKCTDDTLSIRPTMKQVVRRLKSLQPPA